MIICHRPNLRLEQGLRNILENAIRYVPSGGNIEVRWTHSEAPNSLELRVKDDGPGISAEHQARLFELFYRVDEGRSRATGGTGIGLSVAKRAATIHDGYVWVTSDQDEGNTFYAAIPAQARKRESL